LTLFGAGPGEIPENGARRKSPAFTLKEETVARVFQGRDGMIQVPGEVLHRRSAVNGEFWLEAHDGGLLLLPRLADLRKLYVEPTTACNLSCRTCARQNWSDPDAWMDIGVFQRLIEQTAELPMLRRIEFCGIGEPLTHPDLLDMIRMARERALAVTVSSNGLLLNKAICEELVGLRVDRLVLSLDGVEPRTYEDIRGIPIADVLANARLLKKAKEERGSLLPALEIEFVAMRRNARELPDLARLASELGATRILVSNVLAHTEEMYEQILYGYGPRGASALPGWPVQTGAWVVWGTFDLPRMHWGAERRCRFVQDSAAVIGWDGGVSPCYALAHNYDYLALDGRRKKVSRYLQGRIPYQSLLEIWTSEEYARFRSEVKNFRFPSCPDCELRATCDLREQNKGCWGWNPSCADCLYAQDIVRCPGAGR